MCGAAAESAILRAAITKLGDEYTVLDGTTTSSAASFTSSEKTRDQITC